MLAPLQKQDDSCEVHLWKYSLTKKLPLQFHKYLSPAEQGLSDRFTDEVTRMRFIAVRTFLKNILAWYTHLPPEEIQLFPGLNDKPFLKSGAGYAPVYFNLSYRQKHALLAVSRESRIGVDLEEISPIENLTAFTNHHFSVQEIKKILGQPSYKKQLALVFKLWTMKEALIKSTGLGFSIPLTNYNLIPFFKKRNLHPHFDVHNRWHIHPVFIASNYRAAVAIKAEKIELKVFRYEGAHEMLIS